mgnify:CR=1 FL=1
MTKISLDPHVSYLYLKMISVAPLVRSNQANNFTGKGERCSEQVGLTLYCSEIEGELAYWFIGIYVIITWQKRFKITIMVPSSIFEHVSNEAMAFLSS